MPTGPIQQEKKRKQASRKKTSRACNHCHKAHMTCDETRPCKRCYQRGLEASCVDAPRKQKKYLMDGPEESSEFNDTPGLDLTRLSTSPSLMAPGSTPTSTTTTTLPFGNSSFNGGQVTLPPLPSLMDQVKQDSPLPQISHHSATLPTQLPMINDLYPPQLSFNKASSPQEHQHYVPSLNSKASLGSKQGRSKFMSHAADSEYSILSDIIKQDDINLGMHKHSHSFDSHSPQFDNGIYVHRKDSSIPSTGSTPTPQSMQHDLYSSYGKGDKLINQYMLGFVQDKIITLPEALKSIEGEKQFQSDNTPLNGSNAVLSFSIAINETVENGGAQTSNSLSQWGLLYKESEDIYAKVRKPFSYTPGFHSLIRYLKTRFARTELIQMAKAMASYRPSFIACTNTLKEDDLIFMEQCFQRTLLEYDKFIGLSGTPTIVWRRTGQIAYVSEEFCILTGWTKEELLNKITFIVELMDDSSVLEYFNLFSAIAYGDFRGATMAGCTLLTPENVRIKTTCMWTLKRDVFGIPMMIVGNFLPIL